MHLTKRHILLIVILVLGALYLTGVFTPRPEYPVLSDPYLKPSPNEAPAVFLQSGTVMAISASDITLRYATPATAVPPMPLGATAPSPTPAFSVVSFPLAATTKIFLLQKETVEGKTVLNEVPATAADITVGTLVTVQLPSKNLAAVAPTKIQILPK